MFVILKWWHVLTSLYVFCKGHRGSLNPREDSSSPATPPPPTLPHILPLKDAWIITLGLSSNCSEQLTTLLGNLFNVEWHELLKVTVGFWLKLLLLNHFYFSVLIGTVQNSLLIPTASLCVWLLSTVSLWYFLLGEKYQAQPQLHFSVDCKAVSQCYDTNMLLSGLVTGGHFIHGSTCS